MFLVLFLPTVMLVLYWSSEMISDRQIIRGGQFGKRYWPETFFYGEPALN